VVLDLEIWTIGKGPPQGLQVLRLGHGRGVGSAFTVGQAYRKWCLAIVVIYIH